MIATGWNVDATKILTRNEMATVLTDLRGRAERSVNARMNLAIFRLASCCGLRASEIATLRFRDVHVGHSRPFLQIRKEIAKCGKARRVPLWWDVGTLRDIETWKQFCQQQESTTDDLMVCSQQAHIRGQSLSRHALRRRFITACRILGKDRQNILTVHHGRHTFISHALAGGRTLAEVRDAAGHSNVAVTSVYLHVVVQDDELPTKLFPQC